MRLKIGTKIALGFAFVILFVCTGSVISTLSIRSLERAEHVMVDVEYPSILNAAELDGHVANSQAALEAYTIFGGEQYKAQRAEHWKEIADEHLPLLKELSKKWKHAENLERLKRIESQIGELRTVQNQIEAVAQSEDNVPALKSLNTGVAPRATKLAAAITACIDEELKQPATPERKALLGALADSRGSLGLSIAAIRAYVLTGQDSYRQEFTKRWVINDEALNRVEATKELLVDAQQSHWLAYANLKAEIRTLFETILAERARPDYNRAHHLLVTKAAPITESLYKDLLAMRDSMHEIVQENRTSLAATQSRMLTVTWVINGIIVFAGALTAYFISRGVSRSVRPILERTNEIALGDLTGAALRTTTNDEFADIIRSINKMDGSLRDIIEEVKTASEEVSAAATQIAASSEEMSSSARQQTSQLETVTNAMADMSSSIGEVAEKSSHAATAASGSGKTAEQGVAIVLGTIDDMNQIGAQTTESVRSVESLGVKSQKIGQVVSVINDVAEQINLLALNAAIEAARAGEHGRGFAVVADEVRKLADRTQTATKEISASITGIQKETTAVVAAIQSGTERVDAGIKRASSADASLKQIATSAASVAELVHSIAEATVQQSVTREQISRSVEGVSAAAQESESAASQCAAAAAQLSSRAEGLRQLVGSFKLVGTSTIKPRPGSKFDAAKGNTPQPVKKG